MGNCSGVLPGGARVPYPVTVGGSVLAMALGDRWLYLGGDFQVVNGVSCPFVARVDAMTGAVDATWRPAPNGDIIDLVAVPGGVVISGSFSRIQGLPLNDLAWCRPWVAGFRWRIGDATATTRWIASCSTRGGSTRGDASNPSGGRAAPFWCG